MKLICFKLIAQENLFLNVQFSLLEMGLELLTISFAHF
jgi:hypothetical protein